MVKSILTIGILLLMNFLAKTPTGKVLFKVSGVDTKLGGNLSSGIFEEDNFPEVGKQFQGKDVAVKASKMEIILENVPVGTYGAVVFQDANKNKELDANFIGFPTEPIGFANGAEINFGPPSFEDASIKVLAGRTTIVNIVLE